MKTLSNLQLIREEKSLTRRELSEKSDVSFRMIQKYEQDDRDLSKASVLTVYKLAEALDCSIYKLMGWKEK